MDIIFYKNSHISSFEFGTQVITASASHSIDFINNSYFLQVQRQFQIKINTEIFINFFLLNLIETVVL